MNPPPLPCLPARLLPGVDLRDGLAQVLSARAGTDSAFVVAGIGSLSIAALRLAGAAHAVTLRGDLELLTLSGTLGADGPHLHASVSDAAGHVTGGHVAPGCIVRTTVEVLLAPLPAGSLRRELDTGTGYAELRVVAP